MLGPWLRREHHRLHRRSTRRRRLVCAGLAVASLDEPLDIPIDTGPPIQLSDHLLRLHDALVDLMRQPENTVSQRRRYHRPCAPENDITDQGQLVTTPILLWSFGSLTHQGVGSAGLHILRWRQGYTYSSVPIYQRHCLLSYGNIGGHNDIE